ncbi:hypothetical protein PR048_015033 [Dryococelus australis]|uniref:Uncharacterized protein n=1 Tax=Dryococelus australis TaxID=614101 RepID=A0ABQ9HGS2_9NEOP|nr:hypothetical protein PR048_015033 [Dryococelus australis]
MEQHRNEGAGETGDPEKTRRPAVSSGTISPFENPGVTRPGIEPCSPWWEASSATTAPTPACRVPVVVVVNWREELGCLPCGRGRVVVEGGNDRISFNGIANFSMLVVLFVPPSRHTTISARPGPVSAKCVEASGCVTMPGMFTRAEYAYMVFVYEYCDGNGSGAAAEYPRRWIERGGPAVWPARSPDLTLLDFFFWGHMKSRVYIRQLLASHKVEPWPDHSRIFASGNLAGRCRLLAGLIWDLPFLPSLHSGAVPCSPHFTLIGSQDPVVKSRPNLSTQGSHSFCSKYRPQLATDSAALQHMATHVSKFTGVPLIVSECSLYLRPELIARVKWRGIHFRFDVASQPELRLCDVSNHITSRATRGSSSKYSSYKFPGTRYVVPLRCDHAVLSRVIRSAELRTGWLQQKHVAYPPLHIATAISGLTMDCTQFVT